MATDRPAPPEARAAAGALVASLAASSPGALRLDGVDLGPALEQRLFFALRDGDPRASSTRGGLARPAGRLARSAGGLARPAVGIGQGLGAIGLALVPRRRPRIAPGGIVALVRQPARLKILEPIDAALRSLGAEPPAIVRVGAAADSELGRPRTARLTDLLDPAAVAAIPAYAAALPGRLGASRTAWREIVGEKRADWLEALAERELVLVALGAAGIESVIRRWRPALLVAFDEVGTWSRILPAVACRRGIPTLNLPHAEAAVPIAIAGADYDRFAVFGSRATAALVAAGIDPARIVETGAPHFDALAIRPRPGAPNAAPPGTPRRILFAAQYLHAAMTQAGLEACHRAALAAAGAVAPAEVVVLPHPLQQPGLIEAIVAGIPVPAGVGVRVEHQAGLHDLIDDAWLLVTGWSNSVFEAALRGVPSLMVDPARVSPVRYAEEGLGIAADSEAAAAEAGRALLDPATRAATVDRAVLALAAHLGPLDGHASERVARLMLEMAGGPAPGHGPATT